MNNKTILGRTTANIDPNSADDWSNYFSMYNHQNAGSMTYSEVASTYGTVGNWMNSGPVVVEMPDRHLSYEKSVMASAESKIVADMQRYNQLWTQRFNNEEVEETDDETSEHTKKVDEVKTEDVVKTESLTSEFGQQILDGFVGQIIEQCENVDSDKTETDSVVDVNSVDMVENEDAVVFDDEIPSAGDDVEFVSEDPSFDVSVTIDIDDSVEDFNEDGFVRDSEIEIIEKVEEPVVCEASEVVAEKKPKAKKPATKKKTTAKKTTAKKTTSSKTSKK